ncbi:MAG: NAD(P)/FAD-dependent oxidoreductase [Candidatus Aenigmarchaeota archaeon]|nr:NAD(P)/FAD-dependent oxidoreductase [Candidatus Aenigmarchaeota archaeon]
MDIKILGAGVAGLTAAIKLAQAGVNVTVFEKRDFVGGIVNDEQAIRNYENNYDQLEFFDKNGIKINHAEPIYKIDKYAPSGKKMEVHTENGKPLFYSVRRGPDKTSLEYQLYAQAVKSGVNIVFNSYVDARSKEIDIISIGGIYNNVWAYGSIYADANVEKDKILFFMDNKYCPKGYIYVVPYGNEITIAATTFDIGCPIPNLFENFIKENPVVKTILEGATFLRHTSGFEYFNIPKTAIINGKKVIGAAAGFLDPSRGFGIKYALLSGILASKSIVEKKNYNKLWKSEFEHELLEGFKRRILLEKMSNEDYEEFVMEGKIGITKYNKFPNFMKHKLLNASLTMELSRHRRRYNMKKIVC